MVFQCVNTRHPLNQFRDEMDRLLSGVAEYTATSAGLWPRISRGQHAVNLWEDGDTLNVELEVPGLSSDQVEISVVSGELTIGLNRPNNKEEGVLFHRRERWFGQVKRVLRLPFDVDADRVAAELNDGILKITLPKAESAKPRKIAVASAS
ncbi:MAG TPA: Hsp20/alpha crystallin family protein [Thermoguttaceae bacterium]|nr:Hsp20/alpha crystallin family protein [Thermoguttaceae bacterium]